MDRMPELIFTPSGATTAISDGGTISAVPIVVTPNSDGFWSQTFTPYFDNSPRRYLSLQIRMLNPGADYTYIDFPDWKIMVPSGVSRLVDILDLPMDAGFAWSTAGGSIPNEARAGDWILDTLTSDLYKLS